MRRSRGFTLLELLVAMFIAALIFAMGYGTINQAVKNREGLEAQQKKLLELQTAIRTLEQDFVQLAPRPIRDPVGGTFQPAFVSNTNGSSGGLGSSNSSSSGSLGSSSSTQPVVVLTRAGWTNPTGLQRPGLQRVAYYFQDGTMRREYWTVLDPTQTSQAVRRDLISHLKSVSLRFMDEQSNTTVQTPPTSTSGGLAGANINWSPVWPPINGVPGQNNNRSRPIGVEITLETEEWGKIVRYVEVAG